MEGAEGAKRGRTALVRVARRLGAPEPARKAAPRLWILTDPLRTPDPVGLAASLPRGAVVIFRAFGAPDALVTAHRLGAVARARGLLLLIGADANLAALSGAHGLHLPERMTSQLPGLRRRYPLWRITTAAHSPRALRAAVKAGADAVLVSAVFPSLSPSAGPPIGPLRFARRLAGAGRPVIALGGVNGRTAPLLIGTGAAGLAVVDGWLN